MTKYVKGGIDLAVLVHEAKNRIAFAIIGLEWPARGEDYAPGYAAICKIFEAEDPRVRNRAFWILDEQPHNAGYPAFNDHHWKLRVTRNNHRALFDVLGHG